MSLVLHTLCIMCCIVSLIYCVVIYFCFNDIVRFLWYTGTYVLFALNLGCLYAYFPYMLLGFGVDNFAANFYLSTYAAASLTLSFGVIYLLNSPFPKLNRFMTAYGYFCVVVAAIMMAVPDIYIPAAYIAVSVTGLVPVTVALYLAFVAFYREGIKRFILPVISYSFILIGSILDPLFAFMGFEFTGIRIFAVAFFALCNSILFAMAYQESIVKTDSLTDSLNTTLEKLHHSNNALMFTRMNPDFLYSSLSLIRSKCDEDSFVAEELTISLSKYLRQTLGFKQLKGIVPVENELELTKAYIAIEKVRNTRIIFEYDIPDDLPEFNIPPLTIQPLIENAVHHAFPEDRPAGHISLKITAKDTAFCIEVRDDGAGMDQETITTALKEAKENGNVGLHSINSRLYGLYGEGLDIESTPETGTTVSFEIPRSLNGAKEVLL